MSLRSDDHDQLAFHHSPGWIYPLGNALRKTLLWIVQVITFAVVIGFFVVQFMNPEMTFTDQRNEMITVIITYAIIFLIITYATAALKASAPPRSHQARTARFNPPGASSRLRLAVTAAFVDAACA